PSSNENTALAAAAPRTPATTRQMPFPAVIPERPSTPSSLERLPGIRQFRSRALDEGVHDLLVTSNVEVYGELVVFDLGHGPVAQLRLTTPPPHRKAADGATLLATPRNRALSNQQRRPQWSRAPRCRRDLDRVGPSGIPRHPRLEAKFRHDFDVLRRQFVDKP